MRIIATDRQIIHIIRSPRPIPPRLLTVVPSQPTKRHVEIVRAHIDPRRGGLPLRIEWEREDAPTNERTTDRTLETTEIVEVEGAGFYPKSGTIRVFGDDESSPPRVLFEKTTWNASILRDDALLPETLTAIPIPLGTNYFDEYRGRTIRAGDGAPALVPLRNPRGRMGTLRRDRAGQAHQTPRSEGHPPVELGRRVSRRERERNAEQRREEFLILFSASLRVPLAFSA